MAPMSPTHLPHERAALRVLHGGGATPTENVATRSSVMLHAVTVAPLGLVRLRSALLRQWRQATRSVEVYHPANLQALTDRVGSDHP